VIKKTLLSLVLILLIALSTFYFWGSSNTLDFADRERLTTYQDLPASPDDTLSVMTYNIGYLSGMTNNLAVETSDSLYDANLSKATSLLLRNRPHIIGFQEIDISADRSYNRNQLDSLGTALRYHQAYTSVNWDKRYVPFPYWPIKYHFGKVVSAQGILSMYPMQDYSTIVLRKPINSTFYENAFYIDRLVQLTELKVGERKLMVMNVHLEAFDADTRNIQAQVVAELYAEYKDRLPVILMGDFNSRLAETGDNWKATEIILAQDNIEPAITAEMFNKSPNAYSTFSSESPFQMIDHIFFNPSHIQKIAVEVHHDFTDISDHLPVEMKFLLASQLKE
jgi:endonuclease/exonuclease/phosphatase family metal-dependent hydrolase